MLVCYKVQNGKEDSAIREILLHELREVLSVTKLPQTTGYIIIETADEMFEPLLANIRGLKYIYNIVPGMIGEEEITNLIGTKIVINVGDRLFVEQGPFKGEKAKVIRIMSGDKIVIELENASVSIPITMDIGNVKVIR